VYASKDEASREYPREMERSLIKRSIITEKDPTFLGISRDCKVYEPLELG